jgi:DNA polymerase III epsilon subunit-like protein
MLIQSSETMSRRSNRLLRVASLVFFDLETTGLRPDRAGRISEIALIDRDGIQFSWTTDQDPPSDQVVARQLMSLYAHLDGNVVIGHNIQFDLRFVTYEAERFGHSGIDITFSDTLGLARRLLPQQDDYQLGTLLSVSDCQPEGTLHTAVGDALATRDLFWYLVERGNLDTLADIDVKRLSWNAG